MTLSLSRILNSLDESYPAYFAETWDNVGLQVGHPKQDISKAVVALDPTLESFTFCSQEQADLLITHHPLFFKPVASLATSELHDALTLAYKNQIALACLHTNVDKAPQGLNWYLAQMLNLMNLHYIIPREKQHYIWKAIVCIPRCFISDFEEHCSRISPPDIHCQQPPESTVLSHIPRISPDHVYFQFFSIQASLMAFLKNLTSCKDYVEISAIDRHYRGLSTAYGNGIVGDLPEPASFDEFLPRIRTIFHQPEDLRIVYPRSKTSSIQRVGVCTGSGGSLISSLDSTVDLYITGDLNYHQALMAKEKELLVIDAGHYSTEILFLPLIQTFLQKAFPSLIVTTYKGEYPWTKN